MCGKGDKRRPMEIDRKTFEENWDRIFRKNKNKDQVKSEKKKEKKEK